MKTLDVIAATIGLAYVVSEYRADRWFWPLSLLLAAFYIVIHFHAHYYANFALNIYNFLISVYGLLVWRGIVQSKDKSERPIGSFPQRLWIPTALAVVALGMALWWLLGLLGESSHPALDGFAAALGIAGMWMLSQKWWQQWICWLIAEPLMIYLFIQSGNYASAALYVVFEVFCILGIFRWKKFCA